MSLPAAPAAQPFFQPRDTQMMKKFVLGGAGIGAGTGLVTSLLNYLGSLKEEKDTAERPDDEDTLYLNLRPRHQRKMASVAGSLAISGAALAGLGSYALVKRLYQKFKKKEIQSQLDGAQQGYVDLLGQDKNAAVQPPAGQPMSWTEGLLSSPGAAALLLGLASAGVTHSMLNKTFPARKPPSRRDPRRVVIRSMPEEEDKMAATAEDGAELVVRLLMSTKKASMHEFHDVISAIGQGRRHEVAEGFEALGLGVADLVKGASAIGIEEPFDSLAYSLAVRDPLCGPAVQVMAAAEFNEHYPTLMKFAAALPEEEQEVLVKIAQLFGMAFRHDAMADYVADFPDNVEDDREDWQKEAGLLSLVDDVLLASTAHKMVKHNPDADPDAPEENVMSGQEDESTEGASRDPHRDKPQLRFGPGGEAFQNKNKDIIDSALAPDQ